MAKFLFNLLLVVIVLGGLLRLSVEFEGPQDTAIEQFSRIAMTTTARGLPQPDSLKVFVCGSGSPLGNSDRAQACIAILTPNHFYIFDSGAGSTARLASAGLPFERLQGVFLTHFHSDHIAEVYELNLNSWVRGRPEPLKVFGPKGVKSIASALNDLYRPDREYRIAHHGEALLTPDLGVLNSVRIKAGQTFEDGDLTVTAYGADHSPVEPAVGYRIDFRGRSVVVSGDSNVTENTRRIANNTDLLLHDALSVSVITTTAESADEAGLPRLAKIMRDILAYHASTDSLIALNNEISVGMIGFYHLVPVPANLVLQKAFERNLADNMIITNDGDWFELPVGTKEIIRYD